MNSNELFSMEIQKYWAPTSAMSAETKRQHLEQMIASGQYLYSEKKDGNFSRAIITKDRNALQSRGISKVTGTYSELQDKVLFWDNVVKAFPKGDTIILGELYLPGGVDRDVGSICRCLTPKALERQKGDKKLEWHIFDVLMIDGKDLLNESIENRITYISEVVQRINHPLVHEIKFYEMDENFFEKLNDIFSAGGEGVVCYKKGIKYTPGKRSSAWTTVKVKQEINNYVDTFITGVEPPTRLYTGMDISSWQYWEDTRTGQKLMGTYVTEYNTGRTVEPVTKNYYYNYPGAIYVGVYDKNHEIYQLCKVAGLTDDFKVQLRDNFKDWYLCPISIGGMMISNSKDGSISIRHPYIHAIRQNDINPDDCTLSKILS